MSAPERIWMNEASATGCFGRLSADEIEYVRADLHAALQAERDAAVERAAAQELSFYENALKAAGYEVEMSTLQAASAEGGNITAKAGDRSLNIALASQEGETQGLVAYAEKRQ